MLARGPGTWTARLAPLLLLAVFALSCGVSAQPASHPTSHPPTSGHSPRESTPTDRGPTPVTAPTTTHDWGPTPAEWDLASRTVAGMSLAQKAGQVIVAGFDGTAAPRALVRRYHLGGVIVMGANVASAAQVRSVNEALQDEARRQGRTWPLVIGVDQEGGRVARIQAPLTEFPTYMTLGAAGDPDLARQVAYQSGTQLRGLGFTMVFAPDADVTQGPTDPTIGSRSAGSDPHAVARMVEGSLRGYADAGIVAVPKHFPGHGSVSADSHVSLPVQEASLADLEKRDLVPFQSAVDAGVGAVMVAHLDVRAVDPGVPSSVSAKLVDGVLRKRLGFSGVVVTDALEMAGVADQYGSAEAGVRALLAGADLLLLPSDVAALHTAVVDAVRSGRLPVERLDEAATRSVALMLHQAATAATAGDAGTSASETAAPDEGAQVSYQASLAGLTVVSGQCEGRLVGPAVRVVGGQETDRERFRAAAQTAGLDVDVPDGDVVRLLGPGDPAGDGDVVVALDTPYVLGKSRGTAARLALYGRSPQAFQALVDVLVGRARATGRLPVDVDGAPRGTGCR